MGRAEVTSIRLTLKWTFVSPWFIKRWWRDRYKCCTPLKPLVL